MIRKFEASYTNNIRRFLAELFEGSGITAYYRLAPTDAPMPYVVWDLRGISGYGLLPDNSTTAKRYVMEVNGFAKSRLMDLENMFDFLEDSLQGYSYGEDDFFVSINAAYPRIAVSVEKDLQHLRTSFEVKYFN